MIVLDGAINSRERAWWRHKYPRYDIRSITATLWHHKYPRASTIFVLTPYTPYAPIAARRKLMSVCVFASESRWLWIPNPLQTLLPYMIRPSLTALLLCSYCALNVTLPCRATAQPEQQVRVTDHANVCASRANARAGKKIPGNDSLAPEHNVMVHKIAACSIGLPNVPSKLLRKIMMHSGCIVVTPRTPPIRHIC